MPPRMRARHPVFGVKDVPDTAFYHETGWTRVDDKTPTLEDERRSAINEARRDGLDEDALSSARVAAALAPEQPAAPEKPAKARKDA